jgi:hypothetical protein
MEFTFFVISLAVAVVSWLGGCRYGNWKWVDKAYSKDSTVRYKGFLFKIEPLGKDRKYII